MTKPINSDFPFTSKYIKVNDHRIHYVDEGNGDPILFIHGNPTSSYIWRNIIPYVTKNARAIAVDLIGFGKSDQPDIHYGFEQTYHYLEQFIEKLNLQNITIVVQDWGSGLGFHYANTHRKNIKGIAFMEAMYEQKKWENLSFDLKLAMNIMRSKIGSYLMLGVGNQFIKKMLPDWVERGLSIKEMKNYDAPFKSLKNRKPIYMFPRDVPIKGRPSFSVRAVDSYNAWLQETSIPKICFYVDPGVLIPINEIPWIEANFPNITMVPLGKGAHFVQEDYPHEIGQALNEWFMNI